MADSKITALTAISTVDPAADPLVIVDVSDTSMAASGTTKKATINQLLGASGTATLASATITGDLTVRTTGLVVGSTATGIGTTPNTWSGAWKAAQVGRLTLGNATTDSLIGHNFYNDGSYRFAANDFASYYDQVGGAHIWGSSVTSGTAGNAIGWTVLATLNSTGLGVGNAPVAALDVYKVANDTINRTNATFCFGQIAGLGAALLGQQSASAPYQFNLQAANAANSVQFPLVLQPSGGNVGIGVTPSAWNSNYNALDIGQNGTISGRVGSSNTVDLASNGFRNTSGNWVYKLATSNTACRYQLDGSTGSHIWYSGAAGTAGNTIAGFSSALMTLDASGNLILQPPSSPPTLGTNGQLTVNATSNTNLRFSYRGSDGVTRVANITLA